LETRIVRYYGPDGFFRKQFPAELTKVWIFTPLSPGFVQNGWEWAFLESYLRLNMEVRSVERLSYERMGVVRESPGNRHSVEIRGKLDYEPEVFVDGTNVRQRFRFIDD
jgi:hypothetical protein